MTETATKRAESHEAQKPSEEIAARPVEEQTAKLPSDIYFGGTLGSIGVSLYFELKGKPQKAASSVSGFRRFCCSEFITSR